MARPFDATVEPCAYEGSPLVSDLAPFSTCRSVFTDYGLRPLKLAIQVPKGQESPRQQLQRAVQPLADAKTGLVALVDDPRQAEWLLRLDDGKLELFEASGNRAPFPLPSPDNPALGEVLRQSLEKVYRARNLVALSSRFEGERYRGSTAVDVEVEVLRHKDPTAPGEALRPRRAVGSSGRAISSHSASTTRVGRCGWTSLCWSSVRTSRSIPSTRSLVSWAKVWIPVRR